MTRSSCLTRFIFILSFFFLGLSESTYATVNDSLTDNLDTTKVVKHSARMASLLSLAVPGLGQVYNKKYWKLPLVYAGIGIPLYFARKNHSDFIMLKEQIKLQYAEGLTLADPTVASLVAEYNSSRRKRDFLYIITGVFYLLNVMDAAVDAHFFNFDIGDDLSLQYQPSLIKSNKTYTAGFQLAIHF